MSYPDSAATSVNLDHLDDRNTKVHEIGLENFFQQFNTSPQEGLTSAEAAARLAKDGPNKLTPPRPNYFGKV